MILECVSLIIQHGTRHTHLTLRLHEFLPKIIEISKEQLALKAKCELLRIAYEICHNVSTRIWQSSITNCMEINDIHLSIFSWR